ncbi:MAG: hypothetical protein EOP09_07480 [Proteobacteria bacterium]|nr:MAG: hypothetical protein EOP09_07480 [Pseudomonadota bacterium]
MMLKMISLGVILSLTVSCAKKIEELTDDLASLIPTDGSQNAATLAGDGTYCQIHTDVGGSYAQIHDLTLNVGGTYTYSTFFIDGATCTTTTTATGYNYATYNQSGTYTLNGYAAISGVGTKIKFVPTAQTMIIRAGTGGGGASGITRAQALATWINSCSSGPGYSTSADQTKSLNGNICSSSGSFAAQDFPVNTATNYQNVVYRNGTTFQIGTPSGFTSWAPYGTSTPVSFSKMYFLW